MDLQELLQKREQILGLAGRYRAEGVRVFGSVARGENNLRSDVDLLIRPQPGCSLFDLGGLLQDLQDLLGCRVDLAVEDGLKPISRAGLKGSNSIMKAFRERLLDILEAIGRIETEKARGKATFDSEALLQVWMVTSRQ